MPTVIMIVVASVLVLGLLAAVWLQQRRMSGGTGRAEADAMSASQRQDDHQGWQG